MDVPIWPMILADVLYTSCNSDEHDLSCDRYFWDRSWRYHTTVFHGLDSPFPLRIVLLGNCGTPADLTAGPQ